MNRGWLAGLVAVGLVPALLLTASPITRAENPAARPYLGILAGPMENQAGAVVREVTPKSPAAQAGLKTGDIIVKIGDKDVKNPEMLVEAIATHKPSDKLALAVMRDGKEHKMEVTLAERPQERARPKIQVERHAFLGVWGQALTEDMKKSLGVTADKGVVVMQVAPESAAAKAGLAKNDVITAVGDQMVTTPEELRSAVQKAGAGKDVTVKVQRGKEAKDVKVKLEEMPFGFGRLPGIPRTCSAMAPSSYRRTSIAKTCRNCLTSCTSASRTSTRRPSTRPSDDQGPEAPASSRRPPARRVGGDSLLPAVLFTGRSPIFVKPGASGDGDGPGLPQLPSPLAPG